jgi:hypothetical protein
MEFPLCCRLYSCYNDNIALPEDPERSWCSLKDRVKLIASAILVTLAIPLVVASTPFILIFSVYQTISTCGKKGDIADALLLPLLTIGFGTYLIVACVVGAILHPALGPKKVERKEDLIINAHECLNQFVTSRLEDHTKEDREQVLQNINNADPETVKSLFNYIANSTGPSNTLTVLHEEHITFLKGLKKKKPSLISLGECCRFVKKDFDMTKFRELLAQPTQSSALGMLSKALGCKENTAEIRSTLIQRVHEKLLRESQTNLQRLITSLP